MEVERSETNQNESWVGTEGRKRELYDSDRMYDFECRPSCNHTFTLTALSPAFILRGPGKGRNVLSSAVSAHAAPKRPTIRASSRSNQALNPISREQLPDPDRPDRSSSPPSAPLPITLPYTAHTII